MLYNKVIINYTVAFSGSFDNNKLTTIVMNQQSRNAQVRRPNLECLLRWRLSRLYLPICGRKNVTSSCLKRIRMYLRGNGLELILRLVLGLGVCEYVRLQVGGLRELLVAAVEGTHVRPIACVDPHVRPQVEVQRKALAAALERAL